MENGNRQPDADSLGGYPEAIRTRARQLVRRSSLQVGCASEEHLALVCNMLLSRLVGQQAGVDELATALL